MTQIKEETDADKTLKEGVFGFDSISSKTELNFTQIVAIAKTKTLSRYFGNPIIDEHLNEFMFLLKSHQRKGMKEFIEGLRSKRTEALEKTQKSYLFG